MSEEEKEQEWIFTFEGGRYQNAFIRYRGTHSSARQQMVARFKDKWAFQYPSEESAGVQRYMLRDIT